MRTQRTDYDGGAAPHDRENERGAAIIFAAITMVMSMFFVALGVDIAMLYNLRRQAQSAVDTAAIGAAQDLYSDADIIANVSTLLSGGEQDVGILDLNVCGLEPVPAGFTKLSSANCISVNALRTELRVRLPDQVATTAFAQVFGVTELRYTAAATVGLRPIGQGGVLPFWIPNSADGYSCLKAGSGSVSDPVCTGPTTGNFGHINFGIWGNDAMGTTPSCGNGGGSNRLIEMTAMGLDHDLSLISSAPHGATVVVDTDSCGTTLLPNAAFTQTGNTPNKVAEGFLTGGPFADGRGGRLTRHEDLSWSATTTVAGFTADDNPLWDFIGDLSGDNVPDSCHRSQFVVAGTVGDTSNLPSDVAAYVTGFSLGDQMIKLLQRCMEHYEGNFWTDDGAFPSSDPSIGCGAACTDPVFTRDDADDPVPGAFDIQHTPRFGYVPRATVDAVSGSSTPIEFESFEPIFLQRAYGQSYAFDPGVGFSGGGGNKITAVTVFIIPRDMLPNGLGHSDAVTAIGQNRYASLLE